jgi:hypothetical protein
MIVSNLRYETDPTTFEQNAVVDVEIDRMTLYEIDFLKEDIRNDILMTFGKELIEQIKELQMVRHNEQRNC